MYKLTVYVPKEYAETVKTALFNAGAGVQGHYKNCCFESEGLGQFYPTEGASPAVGHVHKLTKVSEIKIEMLCPKKLAKSIIDALKESHPYEEPAYDLVELVQL